MSFTIFFILLPLMQFRFINWMYSSLSLHSFIAKRMWRTIQLFWENHKKSGRYLYKIYLFTKYWLYNNGRAYCYKTGADLKLLYFFPHIIKPLFYPTLRIESIQDRFNRTIFKGRVRVQRSLCPQVKVCLTFSLAKSGKFGKKQHYEALDLPGSICCCNDFQLT